ncbi:MAG: Uma2 family endonuclease [Candidatus Velthaea sp.]
MALEYELRDFTVDEYHRMADAGVLPPGERVELLDGKIVRMSPIGRRHWILHGLIVAYLNRMLPQYGIVGQGSFPMGTRDEPQPDVAILRDALQTYFDRALTPNDVLAIVEVADSSLRTDLGPKLALYARFAVPSYLVVDVAGNCLIHHTEPNDLAYANAVTVGTGDTFTLAAVPGITLAASAFLSPS